MIGWAISLLVAALAGVVGVFLAGYVASRCVTWYQITSREGASGYFVVLIGLVGGMLSCVGGLVGARLIASWWQPGLVNELGSVLSLQLIIAGVVLAICRGLADVPPELDGQELVLEVEFRLPIGVRPALDTHGQLIPAQWQFSLGALSGSRLRRQVYGSVQAQRTPEVDGRWIVSAILPLFTSRGKRVVSITWSPQINAIDGPGGQAASIDLNTDSETGLETGFLVPLPARPGPTFLQWSAWLPRQSADGSPWPEHLPSYRFRVRHDRSNS